MFMTILMKFIGLLLAIITPLLSLVVVTPFAPLDKRVDIAEEKVGGFMKGVCHADPQYDLLNEANAKACDPPLDQREIRSIIRSVSRYKRNL